MRLYDEGQHPSHDAGEQTIPMEVIPGPIPAALSSPRRPRLPFLQSLYYLVATLVLLGGTLGGLAMYFGWWGLDHLFDGGVQRGLPVQTLITPTPGIPAPTAAWLAQDAFARPDQPLWGRASDGMVWGGTPTAAPPLRSRAAQGPSPGAPGSSLPCSAQARRPPRWR